MTKKMCIVIYIILLFLPKRVLILTCIGTFSQLIRYYNRSITDSEY